MKKTIPFVITVSRQLGSGGAYAGQELAKRLNVFYADREIISKAAKQLSMIEEELESREEKMLSFWDSFLQVSAFVPEAYMAPQMMAATDRELFNAQTEVIQHIVKERSAIILGRCGFHILRDLPHHVSVFLHADLEFRNRRVQKMYNVSEKTATKMIATSDKERAFYCKTFTGKEWADARNYDISIDTGKVGIDKAVDLIIEYFNSVEEEHFCL